MSDAYPRISALQIDIFDDKTPSWHLKQIKPKKYINYAWIPQTLNDSVWLAFEFSSQEERKAWEETLPPKITGWFARHIIPYVLEMGWGVYDINGYLIKRG